MDDITNLLALTFDEARTVAAIFERFFPNDASGPGAREIGAHQYLDRALAGAYADQLNAYRDGLEALNRISNERHAHNFADCSEAQQDALLSEMQAGTLENFVRPSQTEFFALLLQHLREGLFSDPAYGGNRDKLDSSWHGSTDPSPARTTHVGAATRGARPRVERPIRSRHRCRMAARGDRGTRCSVGTARRTGRRLRGGLA